MEVYKGNIPDNYFVTALCLKHLLIPPKTKLVLFELYSKVSKWSF